MHMLGMVSTEVCHGVIHSEPKSNCTICCTLVRLLVSEEGMEISIRRHSLHSVSVL